MDASDNTWADLECKECGVVERIRLFDLPHTPGGNFILGYPVQCKRCLRRVEINVKKGD